MRVLGIRRNGDRHAQPSSSAASRAFFQHYVDGVNAYMSDHAGDHPIELKARRPGAVSAWSVADLVTLVHFVHYTHSTNFKAEVVAQKLIDKLGSSARATSSRSPSTPTGTNGDSHAAAPVSAATGCPAQRLGAARRQLGRT
jgi:acyl-homoserine lactone acylase PvdQ